jgi:hypothetical protein
MKIRTAILCFVLYLARPLLARESTRNQQLERLYPQLKRYENYGPVPKTEAMPAFDCQGRRLNVGNQQLNQMIPALAWPDSGHG